MTPLRRLALTEDGLTQLDRHLAAVANTPSPDPASLTRHLDPLLMLLSHASPDTPDTTDGAWVLRLDHGTGSRGLEVVGLTRWVSTQHMTPFLVHVPAEGVEDAEVRLGCPTFEGPHRTTDHERGVRRLHDRAPGERQWRHVWRRVGDGVAVLRPARP